MKSIETNLRFVSVSRSILSFFEDPLVKTGGVGGVWCKDNSPASSKWGSRFDSPMAKVSQKFWFAAYIVPKHIFGRYKRAPTHTYTHKHIQSHTHKISAPNSNLCFRTNEPTLCVVVRCARRFSRNLRLISLAENMRRSRTAFCIISLVWVVQNLCVCLEAVTDPS